MSAAELKNRLHRQIDRLQDPEDIQDLFLTVSEFVDQRVPPEPETGALLQQLRHALETLETKPLTSHETIVREAKQWITR